MIADPSTPLGSGFKPYPAMKDSGVPWLGDVPEHWQVNRGKNLFRCIDVRSETGEEELLTVSSERGVVPRRTASVTMFKAESYAGYKLCWPGDLVINSLWAWARGLGVSRYHGIVSTAYGVYRPRTGAGLDPQFVNELVRSTSFHWELRVRSKGVWTSRLQLTDESFLGAPFPLPPLPEQAAIVRFLDHADRRIRRYIRAKRHLIALLNEQKQAIIHRAVSRGLDPNVRPKPSGVEWLGDVPEHWERTRIKHLAKGDADSFVDGDWIETPFITDSGTRLLQCGNVGTGHFEEQGYRYISDKTFAELGCTEVAPGDILICRLRSSPRILAGRACIAPDLNCRMITSVDNCILKTAADIDPRYIVFQLSTQAYLYYVRSVARGGTRDRVSRSILGSISVILPPPGEQRAIADHIAVQVSALRRAVDQAEHEIELLREYRTRLIADVVTGKLDVRAAAANLPDEADEPEDIRLDDAEMVAETNEEMDRANFDAQCEGANI